MLVGRTVGRRRPVARRLARPASRGRPGAPCEAALALLPVARAGAGAVGGPRRALVGREDGRGELGRVLGAAGLGVREADRGQGDVGDVVLARERLDDRAVAVEVAGDERLAQRRLEQAQPALAEVRDGRQVGDLHGRPDDALDVAQVPVLARLDQGDRHAFATGPAGAPGPVHVDLGRRRHVVVDDVGHVLDVQAAGRDVRRDEHVQRALAEAAHDPVALLLRQPAVERGGVAAAARERLREVVDLAPGPGEHERRGGVLEVEDPAEGGQLVGAPHDVRDVADARGLALGAPLALDADADRVRGGAPRRAGRSARRSWR